MWLRYSNYNLIACLTRLSGCPAVSLSPYKYHNFQKQTIGHVYCWRVMSVCVLFSMHPHTHISRQLSSELIFFSFALSGKWVRNLLAWRQFLQLSTEILVIRMQDGSLFNYFYLRTKKKKKGLILFYQVPDWASVTRFTSPILLVPGNQVILIVKPCSWGWWECHFASI